MISGQKKIGFCCVKNTAKVCIPGVDIIPHLLLLTRCYLQNKAKDLGINRVVVLVVVGFFILHNTIVANKLI